MNPDLGIPRWLIAIQVIVSAAVGAIAHLYVSNIFLSVLSFILAFSVVYVLIGFIYLQFFKKER
ncbi:hypothetical protein [Lactococcus termiticola]|uniref:Uncharacterized protein n=1 Tax=Lactococcus termiticola TaxID=2169526 RepID=A0A2R5HIY1_9LACT|nr:hypothetical protein [Lactococcus termiticola]GBG96388.1 hypothetical protein NtB2_00499 [Lactococcus termiticola]